MKLLLKYGADYNHEINYSEVIISLDPIATENDSVSKYGSED